MRYLIGLLITIGLLVLLIMLIINSGSPKSKTPTVQPISSFSTTSAQTRLIIDGPITAEQNHQQVQIIVGQDAVIYEEIQGYNGTVVNSQTFANTQSSYYNFLRALGVANFTTGNRDPALVNNTGLCPVGNRYNFQIIENNKYIQNLWATTCPGTKTFEGNVNLTVTLFEAQVPNFDTLTQDLAIPVN